MKQIWFCLPCQSLIGIKSAGNSEIGSLSTFWCRYIYSLMMTQWSHKSKGKVQGQNKLQIAVNWENKLTIQMRKRNLRSITEARVQVSEHSSKKMRRLETMIALGRNSFWLGAKMIFRFKLLLRCRQPLRLVLVRGEKKVQQLLGGRLVSWNRTMTMTMGMTIFLAISQAKDL